MVGVLLCALPGLGWARGFDRSHVYRGSVHVRGYTTRSGHTVDPYTRSLPHSSRTVVHVPDSQVNDRGPFAARRESRFEAGHVAAMARPARSSPPHPARAVGVARDSHSRIERSSAAKDAFRRLHPCPATGKVYGACPGYVIDHVMPLKRGGADTPRNMQWQTVEAAKAKDRWE